MTKKMEGISMVYTPKDMDDLMERLDKFSGNEKMLAYFVASMTWNLAMKQVDEGIISAERELREEN